MHRTGFFGADFGLTGVTFLAVETCFFNLAVAFLTEVFDLETAEGLEMVLPLAWAFGVDFFVAAPAEGFAFLDADLDGLIFF